MEFLVKVIGILTAIFMYCFIKNILVFIGASQGLMVLFYFLVFLYAVVAIIWMFANRNDI
jgi:hypothetical protein